MQRRLQLLLAIGMLLWLPMSLLEDLLLKLGVLNSKDLSPWVGTETGTAREYALNVWHWDAMILVLGILGAGCFLTLATMTTSQRLRPVAGRS